MPGPLLIYPGEVGHMVDVQDVLAERHEEARQMRAVEIERRKAAGTPLDDLEPLEPFAREERLEGIRIQPRIMSERQRRGYELREGACWQRLLDAQKIEDHEKQADAVAMATDALFDQRRAFMDDALESIEIEGRGAFDIKTYGDLWDALERSRLLTAVYMAAKAAQEMPRGKAWRSGQPQESTSTGSTAVRVQSIGVLPGAATVALEGLAEVQATSPASDTRRTPAQGGT